MTITPILHLGKIINNKCGREKRDTKIYETRKKTTEIERSIRYI